VLLAAVLGVGLLAALLLTWLGRRIWVRRARRSLIALYSRAEAVRSGLESLEGVAARLAEAGEEEWESFVRDAESDERRALGEIVTRMRTAREDMEALPLPRSAWEIAERLEDVAEGIAEQAAAIDAAEDEASLLDAVGSLDLVGLEARYEEASDRLHDRMRAYGVEDVAVYGGGLYI
jgi:hypothetical protein